MNPKKDPGVRAAASHPEPWLQARWLGLILEQATDTLRCDLGEFKPYGLDNRAAPYLGPVREDAHGLLQRIGVQDLLSAEVRQLLQTLGPMLPGR